MFLGSLRDSSRLRLIPTLPSRLDAAKRINAESCPKTQPCGRCKAHQCEKHALRFFPSLHTGRHFDRRSVYRFDAQRPLAQVLPVWLSRASLGGSHAPDIERRICCVPRWWYTFEPKAGIRVSPGARRICWRRRNREGERRGASTLSVGREVDSFGSR